MRLCSDYYSLFAYIRPPPSGGGQIGSNKYQLVIVGFAIPAIIGLSQTKVTEPQMKRAVQIHQRVTVGFAVPVIIGLFQTEVTEPQMKRAVQIHQRVTVGFAVSAIIGLSQTEVTEPQMKRGVQIHQRVTVGFANIGIADRRISITLRLHVMLPCPSFCDVIRIYLPPFSSVTVSAV